MSREYVNNHYVPQWYQKRFIPHGQIDNELFYRNLKPTPFIDPQGVSRPSRAVKKQGTRLCFKEDDLYARWFNGVKYNDIEQIFFGNIDNYGRKAVDFFAKYDHQNPNWDGNMFRDFMLYVSTQKLRTPKGLGWLAGQVGSDDKSTVLSHMIELRQLCGSIWTECIWQIANADQSDTKFIVSDHPVTVYNRFLGPRNRQCRGFNDPDITLHASHTLFPLSLDKVLILTNLSWVRNPYQSGVGRRPNPNPLRPAIFKYLDIQTHRSLSEQEVREINFIIKSRAFQYIAAGREERLYPEKFVSKSDWNKYGNGLLLMPDPRSVEYKSEVIFGFKNGAYDAFDEYGRKPWEQGYSGHNRYVGDDVATFQRFKGDFAYLFGPKRRGRVASFGGDLDDEEDSAEYHSSHLRNASKKYQRKMKSKIIKS